LITLIIDARPPCRRPGSLEKRPVTFLRDIARPRVAKPMGLSRQTLLSERPGQIFSSRCQNNTRSCLRGMTRIRFYADVEARRSTGRPPKEGW
jgi:hypothetical protein